VSLYWLSTGWARTASSINNRLNDVAPGACPMYLNGLQVTSVTVGFSPGVEDMYIFRVDNEGLCDHVPIDAVAGRQLERRDRRKQARPVCD
jgi:hypothetical protein